MLLNVDELKTNCSMILAAVDSNELSQLTETLELVTDGNTLCLNVTNREYYVQVRLGLAEEVVFHATVNALLFLKLISQMTTETIELNVVDNCLEITGNGKYKLPLIFNGDDLLVLPKITINNITNNFKINTDVLTSINKYNSKELTKGTIANPVQKLYYVDENGCITFTSGACVNQFTLPAPVKLLLNNRLVKLFKLFKDETVDFTLGQDSVSNDIIQTKVQFLSNNVTLTAILSNNEGLISSVPVAAIRGRAMNIYDYSITVNKEAFLQLINRLLLFAAGYGSKEVLKPYSKFRFDSQSVTIYDVNDNNNETLPYLNNNSGITDSYEAILDLTDLKATIENCSDSYLTINFGNHQAIVIVRNNIYNVIPECKLA